MVDTQKHPDQELTSIVYSPNYSTPEHPIMGADEHAMFDAMFDLIRRSGIFAEIELTPNKDARLIQVLKKDADHARHLLREAGRHGALQDMINDRTDWF